MPRRWSLRATVVTVLVVGIVPAGCSAQPAGTPNPYAAEIEQAREGATTDVQRTALEDGTVSDAEFQELEQDAIRCVADLGYLVSVTENGYELTTLDGEGFANEAEGELATAAQDDCFAERMGAVGQVYQLMRTNPNRDDVGTLLASCLVRSGLVEPPFTGKDFNETFQDPPYDQDDPRFIECGQDPYAAFGGPDGS